MPNFKILSDVPEFVGLVVVDVTAGGIVLLCLVCTWGTCMKIQWEVCQSFEIIIYLILFNLIIMLNFKILPDVPESVGLVMVDVMAGGILLCLGCGRGTCM